MALGDRVLRQGGACAGDEAAAAPADARMARDVRRGLTATPKSLPCTYFYDARGSRLFDRITRLPEYYLTRAEAEIVRDRAAEMVAVEDGPIRVVELGSGTSTKTVTLLEALVNADRDVTYLPIDVCADVLASSALDLRAAVPEVTVRPIVGRYREGLKSIAGDGHVLLLWLGSSIGNFNRDEAASFLRDLGDLLSDGDSMLIGIDLAKDASVLEAAYNDSQGVTAEFNLNILRHLNRELGGTFDPAQFRHVAQWSSAEGRIEMYLESRSDQTVELAALELTVTLGSGERIHTENSHKYTLPEISTLTEHAGLALENQWFDSERLFTLCSLRVDGHSAGR